MRSLGGSSMGGLRAESDVRRVADHCAVTPPHGDDLKPHSSTIDNTSFSLEVTTVP